MDIVRVQTRDGSIQYGCEVGNRVFNLEGDLFGTFSQGQTVLEPVRRLAPVVPSAIYAIGLNYRAHAAEMKVDLPQYPVVFMKSPSSLLDPDAPIVLPRHLRSDRVDYECELAVVIGKTCKNVSAAEALDYVLGYTCGNDVSARDWQKDLGGGQWVKGKGFDTFCPLGPVLVTADCIPNPQILPIRTLLNGEVRQESFTGDMIFTVAELIEFLSGSTTLQPGTVILTGTPSGVGAASVPQRFLQAGDEVVIDISGIGRLQNSVVEEGQ
jgi:2-keto-4-pentenoate hydratase/2-oxohepta-3-ene-1,7-dioic acid hydratase in catechol pathway